MRKAIYILFLQCTLLPLATWAQPAQPLEVGGSLLTSAPTAQDSIRLFAYASLTSTSHKYYGVLNRSGDTFTVSYCIIKGFGTAPSAYHDTFNVGILPVGIYTLKVAGNLSNDSCVNKGYYAFYDTTFTVTTSTTLPSMGYAIGYQGTLHPNPANQVQTLSIKTTKPELVSINLTDLSGRLVLKVINEEVQAGERSIGVDVSSLAPGLYFYRIRIGEREQVLKMVKK